MFRSPSVVSFILEATYVDYNFLIKQAIRYPLSGLERSSKRYNLFIVLTSTNILTVWEVLITFNLFA
jgi:hypothetical protein